MSASVPAEKATIEGLARHYGPALRRFFAKRILEEADVDDLVQEVFLRLVRRGEIAAIEHVQAYLFETAANVLKDRHRRRTTRRTLAHDSFDETRHADEDFSPERVHLGRETLARLIAAIEQLPERTRTVFVLHRFEELRYREIAQRLGVSVSAVEKHMMTAIAHVAALFGRDV